MTQADDPATPGVDETGQYRFDGLAPGTYVVRQLTPVGSVQFQDGPTPLGSVPLTFLSSTSA